MRFRGKCVIITGASSGIGRVAALAFAREGAHLVLGARSRERLEALAAELRAQQIRVLVSVMDQAKEGDVQAMVASALDEFGRIDVLVVNAGISGTARLARDTPSESWREILDVNLTGAFYCGKYVSAPMIDAGRGAIVHIASTAGRIGFAMRTPYAASKWGLIGLSHSLAAELAPHGIRVNTVVPGPIDNSRLREVLEDRAGVEGSTLAEMERRTLATIPTGRLPSEQDVADAILYLASDAASSIVGQALHVDGGHRMQ